VFSLWGFLGKGVSLRRKKRKERNSFEEIRRRERSDAIEGRTTKAPKAASSGRKWGGRPLIGRLSAAKYRYSILHGWASVIVRC
jgi:hypothetical protein